MDTVRLAAFADLHLGRKKAPGPRWARESLIDAARGGARAVIFTGDLLDKKKATEADLTDAVDLFRFVTQDLQLPLVHVWGNHDVGSGLFPAFPTSPACTGRTAGRSPRSASPVSRSPSTR